METNKLYFSSIEGCFCYSLQEHLNEAKEEGLKEITLVEAIHDNDIKDYVWCTYYGDVTEKDECRKALCSYYESKSGRGVCLHRGRLYTYGEEITFKVE